MLISYNMWSSNHFSISSCFPCFSGSRFFRVQVFQGPGPGSGSRVQSPGPGSGSKVQGPEFGSRVRIQVLEVAIKYISSYQGFKGLQYVNLQLDLQRIKTCKSSNM